MELNPGVKVVNTENSSGEGIAKLIAGELEIARISRPLLEEEISLAEVKGKHLIQTQIGFDGVCVIIHPDKFKTIKSLTLQQLRGIFFDGSITQWSQLDSNLKGNIQIYVRDNHNSGTADLFNSVVVSAHNIPYTSNAKILESTTELVPAISQDINGITYAPISFMSEGVSSLGIGDTPIVASKCIAKNIREKKYPLQRNVFIATNSIPKDSLADFVVFLLNKEGQSLLDKNGIVPLME